MSQGHFHDVIVVGSNPAAGMLSGLLCRAGLEVLWVGQAEQGPVYRPGEREFPAVLHWLPPRGIAPVLDGVLESLKIEDKLHPIGKKPSPPLQLITADHRMDLGADPDMLLPELRRCRLHEETKASSWLDTAGIASEGFADLVEELASPSSNFLAQSIRERRLSKKLEQLESPLAEKWPSPFSLLEDTCAFFAHLLPEQQPMIIKARWVLALLKGMRYVTDLKDRLEKACSDLGCRVMPEAVVRDIGRNNRSSIEVSVLSENRPRKCAVLVMALPHQNGSELLASESMRRRYQAWFGPFRHVSSLFTLNLVFPADKLPPGLGELSLLSLDGNGGQLLVTRLPHPEVKTKCVLHVATPADVAGRSIGRKALAGLQERVLSAVKRIVPFTEENLEAFTSPFWKERASDNPHPAPWLLHCLWRVDAESRPPWLPFEKSPSRNLFVIGPETIPSLGMEGMATSAVKLSKKILRHLGRSG